MSTASIPYCSVEEYLAREETSEIRHEYFDGEVYAMAGATEAHNLVVTNVLGELRDAVREKPCRVYASNMRVKCRAGAYVYPDISVVCEEPEFDPPEKQSTLLNPLVVIEVLSPSTENYDLGKKFASYRLLPSLQEYVAISQDWPHIEHYRRQDTPFQWLLTDIDGMDATLTLDSIGIEVPLRELYAKVTLVEPE